MRVSILLAALLFASPANAQPYPTSSHGTSFIFGTQPTAAGTVEFEIGEVFTEISETTPTLIKWTPGSWPSTEFSLGSDLFGGRINMVIRQRLMSRGRFSLALAPRATFFVRDNRGVRLGGTLVIQFVSGANMVVSNSTIMASTRPSDTNPRIGLVNAVDYCRVVNKMVTIFVGAQHEVVSDASWNLGFEQGIAFNLRTNVAL